jgi:NitT/TauT family transport system substrate-binding protein
VRLGKWLPWSGTIAACAVFLSSAIGAEKPSFTVAWSVYAGFDPYPYMGSSGILSKWADKYGVSIKLRRFDYAASVDAFVSKNVDACAMTNMEALDMPAAAGVDTTVTIIGDFSNGNDIVMTRNSLGLKDLSGKKVLLVDKTVSEYLLERALALNGLEGLSHHLKLINTTDLDIAGAFLGDSSVDAVATWKPMALQIAAAGGVKPVFNSSQIPGEIVDLMAVRTEVLRRPDGSGQRFAKALSGAWYEVMGLMSGTSASAEKVRKEVAIAAQDSLATFNDQIRTTNLFYSPEAALEFMKAPAFQQKMNLVRQFCFTHGLLGDNTKSVDDVAIEYPDKKVQGKPDRIRLRFDTAYTPASRITAPTAQK